MSLGRGLTLENGWCGRSHDGQCSVVAEVLSSLSAGRATPVLSVCLVNVRVGVQLIQALFEGLDLFG